MLLACDIGNTNIKAGVFIDERLKDFYFLQGLNELIDFIKFNRIDNIAVSSVVPSMTDTLIDNLNSLNLIPLVITVNSPFNIKIGYNSPDTLGIDRICSAEGAYYLYSSKKDFQNDQVILSVDLGTATTINVIKYPGVFIGGLIAPGTNMMFQSLNNNTAQLPNAAIADYKDIIGKTTNEAIASGVLNSAAGLIESALKLIKTETKATEVIVYITGGNFENIKKFFTFDYVFEKGLVLYGINSIYNKSRLISPQP